MVSPDHKESFFRLTTDRVLDAVENALRPVMPHVRATGRIMPLNSLENRVYEIELEDQSRVVAKFYRPGRWTREQISDEHFFLAELLKNEIPVVAPLALAKSSTLAETPEKIFFAVFPKVKGRLTDELTKEQLQTLGRYVARIHHVGSRWKAPHRLHLTPQEWGIKSLETILASPFLDDNFRPHFERSAKEFLKLVQPLFTPHVLKSFISLHGDCHLGNTLWNGEAPFFLDFDDMVVGPAVQDIWMIVRGRDADAVKNREILLDAYEVLREFDFSELALIEPLRGLRILHYCAWIVRRWDDPSFPKAFPHFGSPTYWREEVEALDEISELVRSSV